MSLSAPRLLFFREVVYYFPPLLEDLPELDLLEDLDELLEELLVEDRFDDRLEDLADEDLLEDLFDMLELFLELLLEDIELLFLLFGELLLADP